MKKLLIPFIASFGLSLGVATGVVMVRAPKPTAVVKTGKPSTSTPRSDSTGLTGDSAATAVKDSTGAVPGGVTPSSDVAVAPGSAPPESQAASKAATGSSAAPAASAIHDAGAQQKTAKSNLPASAAQATNVKLASSTPSNTPLRTVVPVVKPATDSLIGRRLAQVFGAMQPKDAARVLEQMDDNDVRAILGSLSSKQQAAILGSFPTQRAALILQATLRTASSGGTE